MNWLFERSGRVLTSTVAVLVVFNLVVGGIADYSAALPVVGIFGLVGVLFAVAGCWLLRQEARRPANERRVLVFVAGVVVLVAGLVAGLARPVIGLLDGSAPASAGSADRPTPAPPASTAPAGPDIEVMEVDIVHLQDQGQTMVTADVATPDAALLKDMAKTNSAYTPELHEKLRAIGGVELGRLTLRMVLEGRRSEKIQILNLTPVIVQRTAPLSGTIFNAPGEAGGADLQMVTNLDEPEPTADSVPHSELGMEAPDLQPGPPYFDLHTVPLEKNEQQVLLLRAVTKEHFVAFTLRVDYMVDKQKHTLNIDNGGRPFALSGVHHDSQGRLSYQQAFGRTQTFAMCPFKAPEDINGGMPEAC